MRSTSTFLLALTLSAGQALTPDLAQSQQIKDATAVARAWLALIDAGKYAEGWQAAADSLKATVESGRFKDVISSLRTPLGALVSREPRAVSLPLGVDGGAVTIEYQTSFEHREYASEVVHVMRDPAGGWRVNGYYMRPEAERRPAVGIDPLREVTMGEQEAAQEEAAAWLELVDDGDYRASWNAASPWVREKHSLAEWEEMLRSLRSLFQVPASREVIATTYATRSPDLPDGRYFAFVLAPEADSSGPPTAADSAASGSPDETIVLQETAPGVWAVVGYFAHVQQRLVSFGRDREEVSVDTSVLAKLPPELLEDLAMAAGKFSRDGVESARATANEWLGILDGGDYRRAWLEASPEFRDRVDFETWSAVAAASRASFGALAGREPKAIDFGMPNADQPERWLHLEFEARFTGGVRIRERITLIRDAEGNWGVAGYHFRDAPDR